MGAGAGDVDIVPFGEAWMEGFLDLLEAQGIKDPLYRSIASRDERRGRIRARIESGLTRASLVAVRDGRVVGSAYANMPPLCGPTERAMAWLSLTVPFDGTEQALGVRLVDRLCAELASQGIGLLRIGMLDAWEDWCRLLRACGFERNEQERTEDAILPSAVRMPRAAPATPEVVRPVRLPAERTAVLDFVRREMAEDLPDSCAPEVGTQAWWEGWPGFDPSGFFVAEAPGGGVVGYACAVLQRETDGVRGILSGMDVARPLAGTPLRERLVLETVRWLRERGARDIAYRVHVGYRGEEEVFERLGFRMSNAAAVWYRPTAASSGPVVSQTGIARASSRPGGLVR